MNLNSAYNCVCNINFIELILPIFFGMYIHIYQLCLIGINSEKTIQYLTPGLSSTIFCLALCFLATEYNSWPLSRKKPHKFFIALYQVIFSSFFVDMGMRTLYVSSQIFYHWLLDYISVQVASSNMAALIKCSEFLKTQHVENIFSLFMSLSTFILVIYTTEKLDGIGVLVNIKKKNSTSLSSLTEESITSISNFQIECVLQDKISKTSIVKRVKK